MLRDKLNFPPPHQNMTRRPKHQGQCVQTKSHFTWADKVTPDSNPAPCHNQIDDMHLYKRPTGEGASGRCAHGRKLRDARLQSCCPSLCKPLLSSTSVQTMFPRLSLIVHRRCCMLRIAFGDDEFSVYLAVAMVSCTMSCHMPAYTAVCTQTHPPGEHRHNNKERPSERQVQPRHIH